MNSLWNLPKVRLQFPVHTILFHTSMPFPMLVPKWNAFPSPIQTFKFP